MAIQRAVNFRSVLIGDSFDSASWSSTRTLSNSTQLRSIVRTVDLNEQLETSDVTGADADTRAMIPTLFNYTLSMAFSYDPTLDSALQPSTSVKGLHVARESGAGGFHLTDVYITSRAESRGQDGTIVWTVTFAVAPGCQYARSATG